MILTASIRLLLNNFHSLRGLRRPRTCAKCRFTKSSNFFLNLRESFEKHLKNRKISFFKKLVIFHFFQKIVKHFVFGKTEIFYFSDITSTPLVPDTPIRESLDKLLQPPCPCLNRLTSSTERLNHYFVIFSAVLGYKFVGF